MPARLIDVHTICTHIFVLCSLNQAVTFTVGFPGGPVVKDLPINGDEGSIPGSGRSPGEGNGSPLRYACLENSMRTEAWQATVHRVAKESNTT